MRPKVLLVLGLGLVVGGDTFGVAALVAFAHQAGVTAPLASNIGQVHQLPDPGAPAPNNKPRHGFKLELDSRWNDDSGYRPVRVVLDRIAASNSDTTVTFQFVTSDSYHGDPLNQKKEGWHVIQDVEVPAESMQAMATIQLPQFYGFNWHWDVFVDGTLASELSGEVVVHDRGYNQLSWPRFLLVEDPASQAVAIDLVLSAYPHLTEEQAANVLGKSGNYWVGNINANSSITQLPVSAFPKNARDYGSLDVIYLSFAQFESLRQDKNCWPAVFQWVAAGGNVWITGVDFQNLSEVEAAFAMDTAGYWKTQVASSTGPESRGWRKFSPEDEKLLNESAQASIRTAQSHWENADDYRNPTRQPPGKDWESPPIPQMMWHHVMLGQVRVFAAKNPFEKVADPDHPEIPPLRYPIQSLISQNEIWEQRHGVTYFGDNPSFWNWLVPGVGLPPVTLFQILITVFVILIGPVNYLFLRRKKRLYLLIVTVPLAALTITCGIFMYAFLADGLVTRVRTRGYTQIDQTTGLAASWARHSYYSGISPKSGMEFSPDAIVLPLVAEMEDYYYYRSSNTDYYLTEWGQRQHLRGEWLPARDPTQYLVVETTRTTPDTHLIVLPGPQGIKVKNPWRTPIRHLVVIDDDGKLHWGENIEREADLKPGLKIAPGLVSDLQTAIESAAPEYPEGLFPSSGHGGLHYGSHSSYGGISAEDGLLEQRIDQSFSPDLTDPHSPYKPGRYIAIIDQSPFIDSGVADAEQQSSLHIVSGRWK